MPIASNASTFQQRWDPPTFTSYYAPNSTLNPFSVNVGNCTWYAWGRAYEILGTRPSLYTGNAGEWWGYNLNNGYYPYGSVAHVGAVACWSNSGAGHVAIVEQVNSDGSFVVSESGWSSCYFRRHNVSKNGYNGDTSLTFQGFIYIDGFSNSPPTFALLTTDKYAYAVDEPVTFTVSSDGLTDTIWIYCPDGSIQYYQNVGTTFQLGFGMSGKFQALVQTWNEVGECCSEKISFEIGSSLLNECYTISVNANGGIALIEDSVLNYGELYELTPNIITRENYDLIGWYFYRPADSKWYTDGYGWHTEDEINQGIYTKKLYPTHTALFIDESWVKQAEEDIDSFVWYAVWRPSAYSISVNPNGGEGYASDFTLKFGDLCELTSAMVSKQGNILKGWYFYRPTDDKWYTDGSGWHTGNEIEQGLYIKRLYPAHMTLYIDNSWIKQSEVDIDSFVWYAVWDENHTHKWNAGVITKSPTCTATGIKTYICSSCGETKTETISKTTHIPGEWTKTVDPTYIQKGTEVQNCTTCGTQLNKRSIPMLVYVNKFTDVKDTAWYSDEVEYVAKRGYMNGMSDTKFSPSSNITREQFIMILANYAKANLPNYVGKTGFSDVPEGKWYSNAIQWARKKGYTDGIGDGKFGLGQEVTREQIAKFLYNYAEVKGRDVSGRADITGYTDDTKVSSWALDSVKWAVYNGIIISTKNDSLVLAPRATTTRAQAARMFMIFNETK